MGDFTTSCTDHLESNGSTKSGTSSVPDLIIKTTNYWESQPHRHKFSETVTLARKLNSYHWQQTLSCFP